MSKKLMSQCPIFARGGGVKSECYIVVQECRIEVTVDSFGASFLCCAVLHSFRGLVDMSHVDTPLGKISQGPVHSGFLSFLAWHGYYFSKQYSWGNIFLNPMFKLKSMLFGRDISRL